MLSFKPRNLLMIFLIAIRVMVAPAWFSVNLVKIPAQDREAAFEQVRLRKRRQSSVPENVVTVITDTIDEENRDTLNNITLPKLLTLVWLSTSRKLAAFKAHCTFTVPHKTGKLFLLLLDLRV